MWILFLILVSVKGYWLRLSSVDNVPYVTTINIGSQLFNLQIGTQDVLTLVKDYSCRGCGTSNHRYNASLSDTYEYLDYNSEICSSPVEVPTTGECGFNFTDNLSTTYCGAISLEVLSFGQLKLYDLLIGRVYEASQEMPKGVDGYLALGPGKLDLIYGLSISEELFEVFTI
jgi:hypothetical protein